MRKQSHQILTAILIGGIVAATVDIAVASILFHRTPGYIMQSIAGGLLANATFDGGMGTVVLGGILQELMGILIAAIYVVAMYAIVKLLPALRGRWIVGGLASGVVIHFVMGYLVLPLSAWKTKSHFSAMEFIEDVPPMLLFGLIVAFFCRRLAVSAEPTKGEPLPVRRK